MLSQAVRVWHQVVTQGIQELLPVGFINIFPSEIIGNDAEMFRGGIRHDIQGDPQIEGHESSLMTTVIANR